jgi:hypothetical protein
MKLALRIVRNASRKLMFLFATRFCILVPLTALLGSLYKVSYDIFRKEPVGPWNSSSMVCKWNNAVLVESA